MPLFIFLPYPSLPRHLDHLPGHQRPHRPPTNFAGVRPRRLPGCSTTPNSVATPLPCSPPANPPLPPCQRPPQGQPTKIYSRGERGRERTLTGTLTLTATSATVAATSVHRPGRGPHCQPFLSPTACCSSPCPLLLPFWCAGIICAANDSDCG